MSAPGPLLRHRPRKPSPSLRLGAPGPGRTRLTGSSAPAAGGFAAARAGEAGARAHGICSRRRRDPRRARGGHAPRLVRGGHPARRGGGNVGRRDQRRAGGGGPCGSGGAAGQPVAGGRTPPGVQRDRLGAADPAGPVRHPPAFHRAAGADAGRRPAREGFRRPGVAVPLRGGQHRARQRPLVCRRADRAGRPGLLCGARAAAPGGGGRRALLRRRPGRFHPGRPGRRPGRPDGLRPARGTDRTSAGRAPPALGGGPGGIRDRPAAPVPRGDVRAAQFGHGACAAVRGRPAPARSFPAQVPRQD